MWPEFGHIVWENKNISIIIKLLKAKAKQIQKKCISYRKTIIQITVGFLSETMEAKSGETIFLKCHKEIYVRIKFYVQQKYPSEMRVKKRHYHSQIKDN